MSAYRLRRMKETKSVSERFLAGKIEKFQNIFIRRVTPRSEDDDIKNTSHELSIYCKGCSWLVTDLRNLYTAGFNITRRKVIKLAWYNTSDF